MILDFNSFRLNESSLKKLKKEIHGALGMSDRKRMRQELRHNIITFKFRKRNGDLRTAHGTLHPDYLPALKGGGPRPEHQMVYFDLDKDAWRSFRSYSFIKITDIKPVDDKKVHSKPIEKEEEEEIKKTKPIEKEEKAEKEEKIEKKVEKEEPEKKHIEKEEHKPEHKEEHKKVHKEPDDDSKEDDSEKDDEVFTKKKSFTHTEHKEKEEHKDEHSDEDKKDKHKEKDEDE